MQASLGKSSLHSRRYWLPDAACKACTSCELPFTLFRRRHHCRWCGKIFCHACSKTSVATPEDGRVRVCDDCRRVAPSLMAGAPAEGVSSITAPLETPGALAAAPAPTASMATSDSLASSQPALEPSPSAGDAVPPTAIPLAARAAKEFDLAPGGGGLGVLDDRRRLARPRAALFNLPTHPRAADVFKGLCEVGDAHLSWIVRRAVEASFPARASALSAAGAPGDAASAEGDRESRVSQWTHAITSLARRAVAAVDPNIRAGDRADVRVYIKVKAVPSVGEGGGAGGGASGPLRVGTCEIFSGVSFRRSLAHKQMRQDVQYPRIMLLNGE